VGVCWKAVSVGFGGIGFMIMSISLLKGLVSLLSTIDSMKQTRKRNLLNKRIVRSHVFQVGNIKTCPCLVHRLL